MINKYAEIQNRALLYNACKGILRVKQASDTKPDFYIDNYKVLHDDPDFYMDWDFKDEDLRDYGIRRLRENLLNVKNDLLNAKNDATSAKINAMSNAGIAKNIAGNARTLTNTIGAGIGGWYGSGVGFRGANILANYFKLLGKDKSLNRRRLGTALQVAGLLGGGIAGGFGGHWLGNKLSDKLYNTDGLTYTSPDNVLNK